MLRRVALLAVLVAAAGLTTVALSGPAAAAGITSSTISSPASGTHFLITDAQPATTVTVSGSTSGGAPGDLVDIRCYDIPGDWQTQATLTGVAVDSSGNFSAQLSTDVPWGSCVLRAVPHGYPANGSLAAFSGPTLTTEYVQSHKILTGPYTGTVDDYYVEFVSAHAMSDYHSATSIGLEDARLQYADGTSSNLLWNVAAALPRDEGGTRSSLRVDGRNAYGPYSATHLYAGSDAIPGLPALTFSATRNASTGTTTIHETDPIVACPSDTYPPTTASCPQFVSAGVRLERTIVTDDGGRQVHIADVWRSTDSKAHTVTPHYGDAVDGHDHSTGMYLPTLVGMKLPWAGSGYQTFAGDTNFPGPAKVPATMFVRDEMSAADGNAAFPRGALIVDVAPTTVHRDTYRSVVLQDPGIKVPADGHRLVRQDFVMGTTQSAVDAKAAADAKRINPWRPDALIRTKTATSYTGNNVYNTTATKQTVGVGARRGASATFYVKVQNDGTQPDSFAVKGAGAAAGFGVQYYAGRTNITSAVEGGSYLLKNLAPGVARTFRLVVTVKSGAPIGALRSWLVRVTSTHDGTRKDAVKAQVHVVAR